MVGLTFGARGDQRWLHGVRRSFGRCSPEGLRRVRRYGMSAISGRFGEIGKPVFGRVSGPLLLGRDKCLCPCR